MTPLNDSMTDYMSPSELADFEFKRLQETLIYAGTHSPYYAQLFKEIGYEVQQPLSLQAFKGLPFTEKKDLQMHNSAFRAVPIGEIAEYVTTSGTLGKPVHFMLTRDDLSRLAYNESRGLAIAGVGGDDIVQLTTTLDRRFMAGLAYYLGCQRLGAATIRTGIGLPAMQCETIFTTCPTVLVCVPSFAVKLIDYTQQNGIDLNDSSVKKLICIGEPIREQLFAPNKVNQYITDHWHVQLFSTYASTEMATAFTECQYGCGGHQLHELIYTEVIDEAGEVVPDGQPGELVITNLGVQGMPLIRFKTGDVVYKTSEQCSCGRTSARLSPVIGRKGQMIKYKGTTIFPSALQHILDHMPEVETYVIEAISNDFEEDEVQVLLSIRSETQPAMDKLHALFKAHLRVTPKLILREAAFINHLRNRPDLRKPVVFIDNRFKS